MSSLGEGRSGTVARWAVAGRPELACEVQPDPSDLQEASRCPRGATPTPQPFRDGDHACYLESPEDLAEMIFILSSEGCELRFAELQRELKNDLKLQ